MQHFLGIDIGGTNVKFGIVSEKGELIEKIKYPTIDVNKDGKFMENFTELMGKHLDISKEIKKVGIGVPGTISKDRTSTVELANIPSLNGANFVGTLSKKFKDVTFHLENDANAAALGEYYFGEEGTPESYLFITLGTGVGGAAIIDKQIFHGANGNALEIGHIISGSGKTVEHHLGKKGIIRLANKLIDDGKYSTKLKKGEFDSKKVAKAAHKGDKLAKQVYKKLGTSLGEACVSGIRMLDVDTILIGGGVGETFKYMEKNMYKVIHKFLSENYTKNLVIRPASLLNEAGIVGAASLCFMD